MYPNILEAVIPTGQTTSNAVDLKGNTLLGIVTPPALTGSALTFLVSVDGGDYVTLKKSEDGSSAYSVNVAANLYIPVVPSTWIGIRYVKVVSGSTETRAGDTTIKLIAGPV